MVGFKTNINLIVIFPDILVCYKYLLAPGDSNNAKPMNVFTFCLISRNENVASYIQTIMIFTLQYGSKGHKVELPDSYSIDVIESVWTEGVGDQSQAITDALRKPYDSRPLKEIVSTGDRVGIIFSDITRATPYNVIIPSLLGELGDIRPENIRFFCANGTHRMVAHDELKRILGGEVVSNYEIIQNEAGKEELFDSVGKTSSGNDILVNKEILKCDLKILTGFIEPHFFAGFSGGAKALIPGMAHVSTIKYNHSVKYLSHENAKWGITDGNPFWEEVMEAAGFIPGLFLLNVALNRNKEITNVFAGNLKKAHAAGCTYVKRSAMMPVRNLYDIVITSNSGYPLDLNVYQAVKGMSAAAQIVKNGGHIIIAAECWDGIPSGSDYEKILTEADNAESLLEYVEDNEGRLKDTWQVYLQARIMKKANVYLYSDRLENDLIRRVLLVPADDIGLLTEKLVRETGPGVRICILPEGPQTIPYLS